MPGRRVCVRILANDWAYWMCVGAHNIDNPANKVENGKETGTATCMQRAWQRRRWVFRFDVDLCTNTHDTHRDTHLSVMGICSCPIKWGVRWQRHTHTHTHTLRWAVGVDLNEAFSTTKWRNDLIRNPLLLNCCASMLATMSEKVSKWIRSLVFPSDPFVVPFSIMRLFANRSFQLWSTMKNRLNTNLFCHSPRSPSCTVPLSRYSGHFTVCSLIACDRPICCCYLILGKMFVFQLQRPQSSVHVCVNVCTAFVRMCIGVAVRAAR